MNTNTESAQSRIAFNTCWHRSGMREKRGRRREGFTAFDPCRTYLPQSRWKREEKERTRMNEWSVQGKSVGEFHLSCRFQLFSQDGNGHCAAARGGGFVHLIHTFPSLRFSCKLSLKLQDDFQCK